MAIRNARHVGIGRRRSTKVSSGFITGGLSSAAGRTALQIADGVLSGGISGVAFTELVSSIATCLTQSCGAGSLIRLKISAALQGNIIGLVHGRQCLTVIAILLRGAVWASIYGEELLSCWYPSSACPPEPQRRLPRGSVVGIDPRNGLLAINEAGPARG